MGVIKGDTRSLDYSSCEHCIAQLRYCRAGDGHIQQADVALCQESRDWLAVKKLSKLLEKENHTIHYIPMRSLTAAQVMSSHWEMEIHGSILLLRVTLLGVMQLDV